ncbi:hypothetical protein OIO03_25415, partial [Acinetobacter baumannii]|nr:hypothetical protein [Acinetobacter baumannii]MCW1766936.1 hypothetical protein [Acinetobacter baumannii]
TPIQTSRGMAASSTSSPTTTAPIPPPDPAFFRLAMLCTLLPLQTIVTNIVHGNQEHPTSLLVFGKERDLDMA